MGPNKQSLDSENYSRSCLVVPFLRGKKSGGSRGGASATRESILESNQNLVESWEYFGGSDTFQNSHQFAAEKKSTMSQNNETVATEESSRYDRSSSSSRQAGSVNDLLTPPKPADRSNKLRYERSQRRRGLYEGEIEPEGTRGQEAPVSNESATPARFGRDFQNNMANFQSPSVYAQSRSTISENDEISSSSEDVRQQSVHDVRPRSNVPAAQFSPLSRTAVRMDNNQPFDTESVATEEPPSLTNYGLNKPDGYTPETKNMKASLSPGTTSAASLVKHVQNKYTGSGRVSASSSDSEEDIQYTMQDLEPSPPLSPSVSPIAKRSSPSRSRGEALAAIERVNSRAMEYSAKGDYDRALHLFSKVLDFYVQHEGQQSPKVASAYHNLGTVYAKRANVLPAGSPHQQQGCQEAMRCFQAAARTARDTFGKNHPNIAVSLVRVGFLLLQQRQYINAATTFQEALRIRTEHYGPDHRLVANLYNNLGVCFMHLQDFEKGTDFLNAAMRIQRMGCHEPSQKLELADTLFNIGGLAVESVRIEGPDTKKSLLAENSFAECYTIRSEILGPDDPATLQAFSLLSMSKRVGAPPQGANPNTAHQFTNDASIMTSPQYHRRSTNSSVDSDQRIGDNARKGDNYYSRGFTSENGVVNDETSNGRPPRIPGPSDTSGTSSKFRSNDRQIFREERGLEVRQQDLPPVVELSFSHDSADHPNETEDLTGGPTINGTRVLMSSFTLGFADGEGKNYKAGAYDGEEDCLVSDTGVDSDLGKIHFPVGWTKQDSTINATRDITVSRSLRIPSTKGLGSVVSENWGSETNNFGSETVVSTGNKERDQLLLRAKSILQSHQKSLIDSDHESENSSKNFESTVGGVDEEEGVAPLGGDWPQTNHRPTIREMFQDPMRNVHALHKEASFCLQQKNFPDALNYFDVILQCQLRRHGAMHEDVAAALHNVGITHLRAQNPSEALKAFQESARARKGTLGEHHRLVAVSLVKCGVALLLLHRFDEALWSFKEALSVRQRCLGELHPSTARIYNSIGCVHVEFDQFNEARSAFENALSIQKYVLSSDPESPRIMFATATTLCNLGYLYRFRNLHQRAASYLKEAADFQEEVLGRYNATVLSTMDILADSLANSGNTENALKVYNMILDRFRANTRRNSKASARAEAVLLYKMSRVHRQRNDRASQLDALKLAMRSISSFPTGDHDTIQKRIEYDMQECKESIRTTQLTWV